MREPEDDLAVVTDAVTVLGSGDVLDDLARLERAVRAMTRTRDQVLARARGEGRPWSDIAAVTGVPAPTGRGRLDRHRV